MKTASHPPPTRRTPVRRARHGAVPAGQGVVEPDGAAGPAAPAPRVDAETRDAQIHRLAYARYVGNGCIEGRALDDWLAAEAEVAALAQGGDAAGRALPDT